MAIHPIITTNDVKRLKAFYERVLGAKQTLRVPEKGRVFYLNLRIDDSDLGLVAEKTDTAKAPRIVLSASVEDVDALLSVVEEAGGKVLGPPTDMPWGQRVAHVHDPDGNMLNLTRDLA